MEKSSTDSPMEPYDELWKLMVKLAGGEENLKGKRICEIGSKTGYFIKFLREKGIDAVGVDPSAWEIAKKLTINSHFEKLSPEEIESFDFIVSRGVMSKEGLREGYLSTGEVFLPLIESMKALRESSEQEEMTDEMSERLKKTEEVTSEQGRFIREKAKEIHGLSANIKPGGLIIHMADEEILQEGIPEVLKKVHEHCKPNCLVLKKEAERG